MKICYIAPGNSVHSYRWIKFFVEKGYEIHWLSFYKLLPEGFHLQAYKNFHYYETNPPLDIPLTPFLPPVSSMVRIFSVVKWIKELLRAIAPDLLHAHSVGIFGTAATMSGFHPLVATAWGSDVLVGGQSRIKRPLVKYILKKAELLTCDAQHMAEAMTRLGADEDKIRIINFGVDTRRFRPAAKDEKLLKELKSDGHPLVISLRNFYPVYDIDTLIKAVPLVLQKAPDTKFVLVGRGPDEQKLKELSQSLGVAESIRFTGPIPNEELPRYLCSADIYVSTALSDAGIAASTAEAMSCGLPVVITDSGENAKWIIGEKSGFLVPVRSPQKIAEKITRFIDDGDFRRSAGMENRKIIMEKNDYYKEMEKMEEIYIQMASKRNGRLCADEKTAAGRR